MMAYWITSLKNRESDILSKVYARNNKFSKVEVAYSNYNFSIPSVNCSTCIFYNTDKTCRVVNGSITPTGLSHFYTPKQNPPNPIQSFIASIYAILPPYTTFAIVALALFIGARFLTKRFK